MNFRFEAAFFMSGGGGVNILHELWYGNICPSERPIMKDSEYAQALHKAADEKDGLLSSLSSELQKGIERLLDVHMEAAAIAERDAFVMGFRLAVQILMDSLTDSPIAHP